ncbi:MAG: hypothetical protein QXI60_10730 [Thermofilaceae archaeon]
MDARIEDEMRKRIAKELLAEILVPIEVKGPCGSAKAWAVVDTGATVSALMPEVLALTCLENERPGDVVVADGRTIRTRAGEVELKVGEGECPPVRTTVFEGAFNLVGTNYMDEVDMVVDVRPGTVSCRRKER